MAEYIDREALYERITALPSVYCAALYRGDVETAINEAPAADVAEVKHGEWIYSAETIDTKAGYFCSACKDVIWHSPDVPQAFRRCPTCGAKMRIKENDHE